MQGLKNIFNFYINASIHVGLAVVCLSDITNQIFDIPGNYKLLFFIFFASVTGYNFVKYAGIAKLYHLSLRKNLRQIQIFSLVAFAGLISMAFYQSVPVLLFSGVLGLFTLFYALPLFGGSKNLRNLSGLKIFVIAFVWAGVTVLLPLVNHINLWQLDVVLVFLQRFFLVLALILPFEIRDLRYDMVQLRTIPQKFGVQGTRIFGVLMMGVFLLLEIFKTATSLVNAISMIFVAMLVIILLKYSTLRQSRFYASFWVEGVPILWWLFLTVLLEIT